VFGVLILTAFLTKTVFSRGMGVHIILAEIPEGWGGLFLCSKYGNSGEEGGGAYVKFPPWWECGYFLELHI